MDLSQLYRNRRDFTIIGLTGRTGSGCSKIAEILSSDISKLSLGLRDDVEFDDVIFRSKYSICKNFIEHSNNWTKFEVIRYKDVLLLYILISYKNDISKYNDLLKENFKESSNDSDEVVVSQLIDNLEKLFQTPKMEGIFKLINNIECIQSNIFKLNANQLKDLNEIFFGKDFKKISKRIFKALESKGYFRRTTFLHWIATSIRSCGSPISNEAKINISNIYNISKLINQIIKARRRENDNCNKSTNIVIDSLRNSIEISYFKERYSAFYMVCTKDVLGNSEKRLEARFLKKIEDISERKELIKNLIDLDKTEFKTGDFNKGQFSSPDVENCIQKSEYHIYNLRKEQIPRFTKYLGIKKGFFLTREEQLMKLICLIKQPGLITPSSVERTMQIANTAKLNSGCISRKVGAVITDENFYVKSIGWNDVPKGHTPCNLRDFKDFKDINSTEKKEDLVNNPNYTPFEKGLVSDLSSYKYKEKNKGKFPEILNDYFSENFKKNKENLSGRNCAFCFKTIHNHYEGEVNQVHTKSLHAEENAMLQITKVGGQGVKNGNLFTTASPCELCSKKAYQLGIKYIYYIDPYPGISKDQIIDGGNSKPELIPFTGALGATYSKLYESFMSIKDENSLALDINPKNKNGIQFEYLLEKYKDEIVVKYLEQKENLTDADVKEIIIKGIEALNLKPTNS